MDWFFYMTGTSVMKELIEKELVNICMNFRDCIILVKVLGEQDDLKTFGTFGT